MDRLFLARPRITDNVTTWKRWANGICSTQIGLLEKKADMEQGVNGTFHELFDKKRKKFYTLLKGKEHKQRTWSVKDPETGEFVHDPDDRKVQDLCSRRLRTKVPNPFPFLSGVSPMKITEAPGESKCHIRSFKKPSLLVAEYVCKELEGY